ncbi:MAG: hypothetical protein MUE85_20910 [Microscillaceae bacterium]|jgi:ABC-type transporter Mla subunit MlaD|nr:hypothetical protein [Microscillaceae bacterium]
MHTSKDVFEKEVLALNHAKSVLKQSPTSPNQLLKEYEQLSKDYEKLLNDAKVITNISDRLQNKLNQANDKLNETNEELNEANHSLTISAEEIQRKNELLQKTNELLQETIEELVKARVGRRAATVVLMVAILLFVLSEVFLEPIIDDYFQNEVWMNLIIKLLLALSLRPIDYFVEHYLRRAAMKKTRVATTSEGID